jgi:hypothetical protein
MPLRQNFDNQSTKIRDPAYNVKKVAYNTLKGAGLRAQVSGLRASDF